MRDQLDIPGGIVRRMRLACAHLPEAYEEQPFGRIRWRIRGRTLVDVVCRDLSEGPVTYMTVHAASPELEALVAMGDPFYPGWGGGLLAMVLREDGSTNWDEVKELVTESYCLLAPKKLIARLSAEERPPD